MSKQRRSYHLVNEQDFSTIKTLLEARIPLTKIKAITGRSSGVIVLIRESTNLADYRAKVRNNSQKYNNKEVVAPENQGEAKIKIRNQGDQSELVEALKEINSTLVRLAIAWETRPAKTGLFG